MEEYQKRVIEEKAELDEKIKKLEAFISSKRIISINLMERARLQSQYDTMVKYSNILNQRIINF